MKRFVWTPSGSTRRTSRTAAGSWTSTGATSVPARSTTRALCAHRTARARARALVFALEDVVFSESVLIGSAKRLPPPGFGQRIPCPLHAREREEHFVRLLVLSLILLVAGIAYGYILMSVWARW